MNIPSASHSSHALLFGIKKHSGRRDWTGARNRDKLQRPHADLGLYTDYLTLQQGEVSGTQLFQFLKEKHPELEVVTLRESTTLKGSLTQGRRFYIHKSRLGHPLTDEQWAYLVKQHLGGSIETWKAEALAYLSETQT